MRTLLPILFVLSLPLASCDSDRSTNEIVQPVDSAMKKVVTPTAPFYSEIEHDGRIYVFGKEATAKSFAANHHMQISKTFIGAGPHGETVVFEVDDKQPLLVPRLAEKFNATHGTSLR